jgi:DNA repair protein RecO (recombination protein O)
MVAKRGAIQRQALQVEWSDEGLVLGARRLGETDAVVELFTPLQGRRAGLVHGGAGKRRRAVVEPGATVSATWKARTEDRLGFFQPIEATRSRSAALLDDPAALAALQAALALLQSVTAERQPYPGLHEATVVLLDALSEAPDWPALYVRWEAGLLAALGYGLDLAQCAATGASDDLTHVSPRTGRAVSATAAQPYLDRLHRLPGFLLAAQNPIASGDVADGFALTGSFLESRALAPAMKDLPEARSRLIVTLGRSGRL